MQGPADSTANNTLNAIQRFRRSAAAIQTPDKAELTADAMQSTEVEDAVPTTEEICRLLDSGSQAMMLSRDVSSMALAALKRGECICEAMDALDKADVRHPLARLHFEQLVSQRPRSQKMRLPSDAPLMRAEPIFEEERFKKGSKKYGYHWKYHCTKCGSDWEVFHDYLHSQSHDSQVEVYKTIRTVEDSATSNTTETTTTVPAAAVTSASATQTSTTTTTSQRTVRLPPRPLMPDQLDDNFIYGLVSLEWDSLSDAGLGSYAHGAWMYGDYRQVKVDNAVPCGEACQEDSHCFHWNFNVVTRRCDLKEDKGFFDNDKLDWITGHSTRYKRRLQEL